MTDGPVATISADQAAGSPAGFGWLRVLLLLLWASAFVLMYFARELEWLLGRWPLNFWLAAQGLVLLFIVIVVLQAWVLNRAEAAAGQNQP